MAEATQVAAATRPQHPLEPLTADEITSAVEILRGGGLIGEHHRFVAVALLVAAGVAVGATKL